MAGGWGRIAKARGGRGWGGLTLAVLAACGAAGEGGGPGGAGGKADLGGETTAFEDGGLRRSICDALAERLAARDLDDEACLIDGQFVAEVAFRDPLFDDTVTWGIVEASFGDFERHAFFVERIYDFALTTTRWRITSLSEHREAELRAIAPQIAPRPEGQDASVGDRDFAAYPIRASLAPSALRDRLESFVEHRREAPWARGKNLRVEAANPVFAIHLGVLDVPPGEDLDLPYNDPASLVGYVAWLGLGDDAQGVTLGLDAGFNVVSFDVAGRQNTVTRPDIAEVVRTPTWDGGAAIVAGTAKLGPVGEEHRVVKHDVCDGLVTLGALATNDYPDCVEGADVSVKRTHFAPLAASQVVGHPRLCDPDEPTYLPRTDDGPDDVEGELATCVVRPLIDGYDVDARLGGTVWHLEARLTRDDAGDVVLHALRDVTYTWTEARPDDESRGALREVMTDAACHGDFGFEPSGAQGNCRGGDAPRIRFRPMRSTFTTDLAASLPALEVLAPELTFTWPASVGGVSANAFAAFDGERFVGVAYNGHGQIGDAWLDRAGLLFDGEGFAAYELEAYERPSNSAGVDVTAPFSRRAR